MPRRYQYVRAPILPVSHLFSREWLDARSIPMNTPGVLAVARAEALFVSDLTAGELLSPEVAAAAIRRAVRIHRGVRGCAAEVAASYGDHPEIAVRRMRWALAAVDALYPARRSTAARCAA